MAGEHTLRQEIPAADEAFTQLVSQIANETGIVSSVLDREGRPLSGPADRDGSCPRSGKTCGASCEAARKSLYLASRHRAEPAVEACGECGCNIAVLPIHVEGERLCTWILWGFAQSEEEAAASAHGPPVLTGEILRYLQLLIASLSQPILALQRANRELEQLSRSASELAYTDQLLGLPNRNQFKKDLQEDASGSILLLDVVDLAKVNDAYGRETGDELLRSLRDHLLALDVPGGKLYRMVAANFGLLVPGFRRGELLELAKRLLEDCAKPWPLREGGHPADIVFTAAVGILPLADLDRSSLENLSAAVAYVVGQAANSGGIALFDGAENRSYYKRMRLEMEMRRAAVHGMQGFSVAYQPIIDPGNALWNGLEALCRWHSEEFGQVSPSEFIPIAETSGLIGELGLWILDEALGHIAELGLCATDHFVLDVNLSPVQLADPNLGEKILAVIRKHDYPPEKLCLEITESSDIELAGPLLATLEQLHDAGVLFALDDFGVGYASLSSLHKLPVNIIKTDRSLVQDVEDNAFLQRLFYVMGELAHVNGMKIVAEGVESESQVRVLLMEGADYFQGYHFSKPLSYDQLCGMLNRFYSSTVQKPSLEYGRESNPDAVDSYVLPPALYSILNRCMHLLFTDPQMDRAINQVLWTVGEALQITRAYVYMHDHGETYTLTHEWSAPGVPPLGDSIPSLRLSDLGPLWLQRLLTEDMLVTADTSTLPDGIRDLMERFGAKSFAEFALVLNGKPIGTVNFDDNKAIRYWAREDVRMLQLLANMLGSVLLKNELLGQIEQQNTKLQSILDEIEAMVYVVDPDTGEILFTNRSLRRAYGCEEGLVGAVCWEALQNRDTRCSFCPVEELRADPQRSRSLEIYNEITDDYLQISMSLIQWQKDKQGILCSSFNITELKDRQKKLEETAALDPLTQIYNRAGLISLARHLLETAVREEKPVTLAFLDVDGLKRENDLRGHMEGDVLLCSVVECLRRRTRSTDLIGRYGGDEFVVLFYNCLPENAAASLEKMLEELALLDQPEVGKFHSFSYGLSHSGEERYRTGGPCLKQMLADADERMMAYKKERRRGGRGKITEL